MAEIPVISSHILHGLPAFLRHEIGERALQQANRAAGFDLELTENRNCFIPHAAVIGFVNAAARAVTLVVERSARGNEHHPRTCHARH